MSIQRCTFFFKQEQSGWSETYFTDQANPDAAVSPALALLNTRRDLLAFGSHLVALRISQEGVNRDARLIFTELPSNGNWSFPLPAFNCIDIRLEATTLYRRMIFLRGIPRQVVDTATGGYRTDPAYTGFLDLLRDELTGRTNSNGHWSILVQDRAAKTVPTAGANIWATDPYVIEFIAGAGNDWTNMGSVGQRVIVHAPRGTDLHGQGAIHSFPDLVTMRVKFAKYHKGPWLPGMSVQKQSKVLQPIDRMRVEGINHRDTGRPFDLHPGRARVGAHSA